MSQHGCPERLSNRSKGFQDDNCNQSTMEVLVETLTGAAFEMTVFPSDTILAIKSKIFRVEGIPVSQQHILYNLQELEDSYSLNDYSIGDGARLKLVLGLRGGPITTRRLLPPQSHDTSWRDIERLFDSNRDEEVWESGGSCRVTVVVFRDGERVNLLRVSDDHRAPACAPQTEARNTHSPTLKSRIASGLIHENAVTMGKMMDLRRRMETHSGRRDVPHSRDKMPDVIQKTRSEETLSAPSLLDEEFSTRSYTPFESEDNLTSLYEGNYTRYEYDYSFADRYMLLPPIGTRAESDHSVQDAVAAEIDRLKVTPVSVAGARDESRHRSDRGVLVMSASTSSLERGDLSPLTRHHNTETLHLPGAPRPRWIPPLPEKAPPPPSPPQPQKTRLRCGLCNKRLTIATVHKCRCGATYCAPHRYAEVHGCAYDYKAGAHSIIQRNNPLVSAPKLPKI